jgi:hypothetical protein
MHVALFCQFHRLRRHCWLIETEKMFQQNVSCLHWRFMTDIVYFTISHIILFHWGTCSNVMKWEIPIERRLIREGEDTLSTHRRIKRSRASWSNISQLLHSSRGVMMNYCSLLYSNTMADSIILLSFHFFHNSEAKPRNKLHEDSSIS